MNSHIISRFLTKHWEVDDRRLVYYDFLDSKFHKASSKRLFASDHLLTKQEEELVNEIVETPFSEWLNRSIKSGNFEPKNWHEDFSIQFVTIIQATRYQAAKDSSDLVPLRRMIHMDTATRETFWNLLKSEFGHAFLTSDAPMFFPETDVFGIPNAYKKPPYLGSPPYLAGAPVHPNLLLLKIPKKFERSVNAALSKDAETIRLAAQSASVGLPPNMQKLVVPPVLIHLQDNSKIELAIQNGRTANLEFLKLTTDIDRLRRDIFNQVFAKKGQP